jgi:hypothetical protein
MCARMLLALVAALALCALPARGEPAVVTVSTPDAETMNALTAAVDMDGGGLVLGAIEGTQSQVVDVTEPYLVTAVQSVPTLSLLDGVSFDNETAVWTLEFETMQVDASEPDQINAYTRLLYLTRNDTERSQGDAQNACLQKNTSLAVCRAALEADYALLGELAAAPAAPLVRPAACGAGCVEDEAEGAAACSAACRVNASLQSAAGSALQTLTLQIRHEDVRRAFGRFTPRVSPLYGSTLTIDFGVGMLFVPAANADAVGVDAGSALANNILIFNRFSVVENTFEQVAIVKQSAYSIATHVAFWTAVAQQDPTVRIATIEYLLDFGHALENVTASLNADAQTPITMRAIDAEDCAEMQALLDDLDDSTCLTKQPLCTPAVYVDGAGSNMQVWATIVFPIPAWHTASIQFNTLLRTRDAASDMLMLSTLNFATSHTPRIACQATKTTAFDATQHVRAEVYRGSNLVYEKISGTFSVHNDTALSMAEALVTLVLRPDDSDQALEYFRTYTDEVLRLDDLYMSHAKVGGALPTQVANTLQGSGGGRSTLTLDPQLVHMCPLRTAETPSGAACVTTHDWGPAERTRLESNTFFVHKVHPGEDAASESADVAWLTNVFGSADMDMLRRFRSAALSRPFARSARAQVRQQYAALYWIWPVYAWPNLPPIGLVDKTLVSLAWSIAPQ